MSTIKSNRGILNGDQNQKQNQNNNNHNNNASNGGPGGDRAKIDPSDPRVRKLVYSMYRDMLTNCNDEANDFIHKKDPHLVRQDLGVGSILESIILRQGSQGGASSGSGSNPSTPVPQTPISSVPPPPPPPSLASGGMPPPPPPPPMAPSGAIPSVRLNSEIGPRDTRGPPMALAGAMMKDKKPFTYTPGGIDLSEIRSPRMAKRIAMNANAEGVSSTPPTQAQQYQQHQQQNQYPSSGNNGSVGGGGPPPPPPSTYLPPAAMAAMNPAMAIPVLPQGGFNPPNLNRTHKPTDFVRQEHEQQHHFMPQHLQQQIQQHYNQQAQQQQQQPVQIQRNQSPLPPPQPPERSSIPIQLMNNVSGANNNFRRSMSPTPAMSGTGSIYIPPLNNNSSSNNTNAQYQQQQQQQQQRPAQTKAQIQSQNLGSIYIPPIEQRPSVFDRQAGSASSPVSDSPTKTPQTPQTPQLNKAPTPWMNSYNRTQQQQQNQQPQNTNLGSSTPSNANATPWGTSMARTIPITIARDSGDEDRNFGQPNFYPQQYQQQQQQQLFQQQQQQQQQQQLFQQQQQQQRQQMQSPSQFTSGGARIVPIQIEREGVTSPINTSGGRNIPIQIEGNIRRGQPSGPGNQTPQTPGSSTPGVRSNPYNSPMSLYSSSSAKDAFNKQAAVAEISSAVEKMSARDREDSPRLEPIQSKSFKVIQKIAADDDRQAEQQQLQQQQQRKLELTDDDKLLMDNIKAQVDEGSSLHKTSEPRFRGGHIPSRAFRTLQSNLPPSPGPGSGPQDFTPSYPSQSGPGQQAVHNIPIRMASSPTPGGQQQQTPASQQQVAEPKKYMGGNIPSRSFKILQAMTADEDPSAALGSAGDDGKNGGGAPTLKKLASRPPRPPCRSLSSTPTPSSPQNQGQGQGQGHYPGSSSSSHEQHHFVRSRTVSPSPSPRPSHCTCTCNHNNNNNNTNNYNNNNNNLNNNSTYSHKTNGYNLYNSCNNSSSPSLSSCYNGGGPYSNGGYPGGGSESESEDYSQNTPAVPPTPRSYSPWPENFDPNYDPYAYMQWYYWWYTYNYGYPMPPWNPNNPVPPTTPTPYEYEFPPQGNYPHAPVHPSNSPHHLNLRLSNGNHVSGTHGNNVDSQPASASTSATSLNFNLGGNLSSSDQNYSDFSPSEVEDNDQEQEVRPGNPIRNPGHKSYNNYNNNYLTPNGYESDDGGRDSQWTREGSVPRIVIDKSRESPQERDTDKENTNLNTQNQHQREAQMESSHLSQTSPQNDHHYHGNQNGQNTEQNGRRSQITEHTNGGNFETTKNRDSGHFEAENRNSGIFEAEKRNSGIFEAEKRNSGIFEAEKRNPGIFEKEKRNFGHFEAEKQNAGHFETEKRNSSRVEMEKRNSGHFEAEKQNAGHFETEKRNSSRVETEKRNSGHFETKNEYTGHFEAAKNRNCSHYEAENSKNENLETTENQNGVNFEGDNVSSTAQMFGSAPEDSALRSKPLKGTKKGHKSKSKLTESDPECPVERMSGCDSESNVSSVSSVNNNKMNPKLRMNLNEKAAEPVFTDDTEESEFYENSGMTGKPGKVRKGMNAHVIHDDKNEQNQETGPLPSRYRCTSPELRRHISGSHSDPSFPKYTRPDTRTESPLNEPLSASQRPNDNFTESTSNLLMDYEKYKFDKFDFTKKPLKNELPLDCPANGETDQVEQVESDTEMSINYSKGEVVPELDMDYAYSSFSNYEEMANAVLVEEPDTPSSSEEDAPTLVNESDAIFSRGVVIEECYSPQDDLDTDVNKFDYEFSNSLPPASTPTTFSRRPPSRLSTIEEITERSRRSISVDNFDFDNDTNAEDFSDHYEDPDEEESSDENSSVSVIENKSDVNNDWGGATTGGESHADEASTTSSSDAEDENDDDPLLPTVTVQLPLKLSFSKSRSFKDVATFLVGNSHVNIEPQVKQEVRSDHPGDGQRHDMIEELFPEDYSDYSSDPVDPVVEEPESEFSIVENPMEEDTYDDDEPVVSFTISLSRSTTQSGKKHEDDSESGDEELEVDKPTTLVLQEKNPRDKEEDVEVEVDFWGEIQKVEKPSKQRPQGIYVSNQKESCSKTEDSFWSPEDSCKEVAAATENIKDFWNDFSHRETPSKVTRQVQDKDDERKSVKAKAEARVETDFWGEIKGADEVSESEPETEAEANVDVDLDVEVVETVNFWDRPSRNLETPRFSRQFSWEISCDEDADKDKVPPPAPAHPQYFENHAHAQAEEDRAEAAVDYKSKTTESSQERREQPAPEPEPVETSTPSFTFKAQESKSRNTAKILTNDNNERIGSTETKEKFEKVKVEMESQSPSDSAHVKVSSEKIKSKISEKSEKLEKTEKSEKSKSEWKEIKSEIFEQVQVFNKQRTKESNSKQETKTEKSECKIDTIFSNRKLDNCDFSAAKTQVSRNQPLGSQSETTGNAKLHKTDLPAAYVSDENSDESSSTTVADSSKKMETPPAPEQPKETKETKEPQGAPAPPKRPPQKESRKSSSSSPVYDYELKRTTSLTKKEVNERNVEIKETREKFKLGPNSSSNSSSCSKNNTSMDSEENGSSPQHSPHSHYSSHSGKSDFVSMMTGNGTATGNNPERLTRAEDLLWRIERFLQESLSLGSEDDSGVMTDISRQISDVDTDNDVEAEVVTRRTTAGSQRNHNMSSSHTNVNVSSNQVNANTSATNVTKATARSLKTRSLIETSTTTRQQDTMTMESSESKISDAVDTSGVVLRKTSSEKKSLRYQRAKTHSRLFQLLQDECLKDEDEEEDLEEEDGGDGNEEEMINFENLEEVEAAIEKSEKMASLKKQQEEKSKVAGENRSRLVPLPIKSFLASSSVSVDSTSSSSGVLSPSSPVSRDQLLADIINEFHQRHQSATKKKVSNFPSKIFKLLQHEFGEEFYDTFDCCEDDFDFPVILRNQQQQQLCHRPTSRLGAPFGGQPENEKDAGEQQNADLTQENNHNLHSISSKRFGSATPTQMLNGFSQPTPPAGAPLPPPTTTATTNGAHDSNSQRSEFLEVPPRRKKATMTRDPRLPKTKKSSHL